MRKSKFRIIILILTLLFMASGCKKSEGEDITTDTEKAQSKHAAGTAHYKRYSSILKAMYISKTFIEKEMSR